MGIVYRNWPFASLAEAPPGRADQISPMARSRVSDRSIPAVDAGISRASVFPAASSVRGLPRAPRNARATRPGVALVTPYPSPNQQPISGVASYSRELARALSAAGVDVEVWAEQISPRSREHDHESVRVIRAWRRGFWAGLDLWHTLRTKRPGTIHAQIEYFVFGGWIGFVSLLVFLMAARFTRARVFVTLHQVLSLKELRADTLRGFGVRLPWRAARGVARLSILLLSALADRVIVHEGIFRGRLSDEYGVGPARVEIIPHGVPSVPHEPRTADDRRLLLFGYLKWYKGIDVVLRAFREVAAEFPDWKLNIAGGLPDGPQYGHAHAPFLREIRALAEPLGDQVELTGYVGDAEIPAVFRRADVVLFPYRVLFAASGPLALAIGFRKPFILSEALLPVLPTWPFWSSASPAGWAQAMRHMMKDKGVRAEAEARADLLAAGRTWSNVAAHTVALYRLEESLVPVLNRSS